MVWVLVSEPGFLLGFGSFPWKLNSFTRNEAQEQHSLLDTIFDYIFYFGPPGKYLYLSAQNPLHDMFLEFQSTKYSQIRYLINYVVPRFHFWNFLENEM